MGEHEEQLERVGVLRGALYSGLEETLSAAADVGVALVAQEAGKGAQDVPVHGEWLACLRLHNRQDDSSLDSREQIITFISIISDTRAAPQEGCYKRRCSDRPKGAGQCKGSVFVCIACHCKVMADSCCTDDKELPGRST